MITTRLFGALLLAAAMPLPAQAISHAACDLDRSGAIDTGDAERFRRACAKGVAGWTCDFDGNGHFDSSDVTAYTTACNQSQGAVDFITLGLSNALFQNDAGTHYRLPVYVMAANDAGEPLSHQAFAITIRPTRYSKGFWTVIDGDVTQSFTTASCASEDRLIQGADPSYANNGTLDPGEDGESCDRYPSTTPCVRRKSGNQNGRLDPGEVAAAPARAVTGADGSAVFEILYPKHMAPWVDILIRVQELTSGQAESVTKSLPLLYEDMVSASRESPFGIQSRCSDSR